MTSLRMLKFDDNPIIFPPADILELEPDSIVNASASEAEAQLTVQIKKFLKQANTAATNRQRLQVESDSDFRYRNYSCLPSLEANTYPEVRMQWKHLDLPVQLEHGFLFGLASAG